MFNASSPWDKDSKIEKRSLFCLICFPLSSTSFHVPNFGMSTRWALVICFACGILLGWFPLQGTDLGHHVATGRWILEHSSIPTVDPFSFTAKGQIWFLHQWLPDVLWAFVEAHGGWTGLVLLRSVIAGLLACALFFSSRARGSSSGAAVLAVCLALSLLQNRLLLRPMILGIVALAALDGCLSYLEKTKRPIITWAAHAILVIWSLVHPLYLIGLVRCFQHMVLEIVQQHIHVLKAVGNFFLAVWLTSLAVLCCMPHGLGTVFSVIAAGRDPFFAKIIVELQPFLSVHSISWLHAVFLCFWVIGFVFSKERLLVRVLIHGLAVLFLIGTGFKSRLLSPCVVLATPFVAASITTCLAWLKGYLFEQSSGWVSKCTAAFGVFVVLCSVMGSSMGFGSSRAENLYPRGAAAFLRENQPKHMFHDLQFGGFVLWDLYGMVPTFIDGRLEIFGSWFMRNVYRRVYAVGPNWQQVLDYYAIDTILLSPNRAKKLHQSLLPLDDWMVAYADPYAIIYKKTIP